MHARNFTTNVPKILDLKLSSEQIFSRKLSLGAPVVKFISFAFSALEAKYCDNDCVDEEDEARSSSGILILALRCEISAALEPDLMQKFVSSRVHFRSTRVEHETQISAILDAANR